MSEAHVYTFKPVPTFELNPNKIKNFDDLRAVLSLLKINFNPNAAPITPEIFTTVIKYFEIKE